MDISLREELALRARNRRIALGLKASWVYKHIGVTHQTLMSWERSIPKHLSALKQQLWEECLCVSPGWLKDAKMPTPQVTHAPIVASTVADEIRMVGAWLSRASFATRTFDVQKLSPKEMRRAQIFGQRYGVLGSKLTTLAQIGSAHGLTRERVRQVLFVMLSRKSGLAAKDFPMLQKLIERIQTTSLMPAEQFDAENRDLLGEQLSIIDANGFTKDILNIEIFNPIKLTGNQVGIFVGPEEQGGIHQGQIKRVRALAGEMIRRCGAANMEYLAGVISAEGINLDYEGVRNALLSFEQFQWLDNGYSWFWFGPDLTQNRALRSAAKIFSSPGVKRVDIEDLHHGLCRYYRHPSNEIKKEDEVITIAVPKHILCKIYLHTPWLRCIQSNDFALVDGMMQLVEGEQTESEQIVVQAIRCAGGCTTRKRIQEHLDRHGFGAPTLHVVLATSPVIRNLGCGVFGVVGMPFSGFAFDGAAIRMESIA